MIVVMLESGRGKGRVFVPTGHEIEELWLQEEDASHIYDLDGIARKVQQTTYTSMARKPKARQGFQKSSKQSLTFFGYYC